MCVFVYHSSVGKESACNAGDLGLIPGLGRSPGEGKGYPLQYSGLENSMDCIVHGVSESDMTEQLSLIDMCVCMYICVFVCIYVCAYVFVCLYSMCVCI